jgi:hypothetical protein
LFSSAGSGTACTWSQPCPLSQAISEANNAAGLILGCYDNTDLTGATITTTLTIDCSGTVGSISGIVINAPGKVVTLKNIISAAALTSISLVSGTLILDNVNLHALLNDGISAQPTATSNLVVRNSVLVGNTSGGMLLKPATGGSLSARLDHVTIASNGGGGLKIDTTSGPVTVDIVDSEISSNPGNGLNAVSGAGGGAIFNISRSVIAKNGGAGVQVNGAAAAAMIDTTLLDSNTSGATSVVNGGHILTYGNNRIVGSPGSGFTSTTPLQ